MASTSSPAKGSEDERSVWRGWMYRNRLTDDVGNFRFRTVSERRRVFRSRLDPEDTHLVNTIESSMINLVHFRNAAVERWPETIRIMLNNTSAADGKHTRPFESWVGPPGLEKRKQATRVWTDLVQFLVLEYHSNNVTWSGDTLCFRGDQGYLPDVGLTLSRHLLDNLMDIVEGNVYGIDYFKADVHEFCLNIIMQMNPSPQNNPLLFWVALLLQTEEFGDQPRFKFFGLEDHLTMREKLEALVHYARVFIMDHAFQRWLKSDSIPDEWKIVVGRTLNAGGYEWCDTGTPRLVEQEGDPADFAQPHWQAFKAHFDSLRKAWLVKGSNSPIGMILRLL